MIPLIFLRVVEKDWMALKSNGQVSDSACFASGWYDSLLEKVLLLFSIIQEISFIRDIKRIFSSFQGEKGLCCCCCCRCCCC